MDIIFAVPFTRDLMIQKILWQQIFPISLLPIVCHSHPYDMCKAASQLNLEFLIRFLCAILTDPVDCSKYSYSSAYNDLSHLCESILVIFLISIFDNFSHQ